MLTRIAAAALAALLLAIPLPGNARFDAVHSRDGLDVWAVGRAGGVHRSFDGGATWTAQTVPTPATLRGVAVQGFTVVVVADGGEIWRSLDSGGTWALTTIPGGADLRAIEMPGPLSGFVVGDAGTVLETTDGGDTWTPLASPTSATLHAACFLDADRGFVVGDGGTALVTTDGGSSFQTLAPGTGRDLLDVHVSGSTVWAVGRAGTALRSLNDGQDWTTVNLDLEPHVDVTAVWGESDGSVTLAGGGGFIRRSLDAVTWTYPVHSLHGAVTGMDRVGNAMWVVSDEVPVVLTSTDGGASWSLPGGASVSRSWNAVLGAGGVIRGSTFSMAGEDQNAIYSLLGERLFVSRSEGATWQLVATIPNALSSNAFVISPKDSMTMVAAVSAAPLGTGDRIVKSTNGGIDWTTTLTLEFGEYGIPVEMDPERPDTLYFGADGNVLYRSTDFGSVWTPHSASAFLSPCDIEVVPGTGGQRIIVGDGITSVGFGQIYLSQDGGLTFTSQEIVEGSEIPGLATSALRPQTAFASAWHVGGVRRTTDAGQSWGAVHNAGSAWGMDIARDDPNVVVFGTYSEGASYLSINGGPDQSSFQYLPLGGTNYSFLLRSRSVILAQQGGALHKMNFQYSYTPVTSQSVNLFSPNGGEEFPPGSVQVISWGADNVAVARIEFRASPSDSWQQVAIVPGNDGSYLWTVPATTTTTAAIRIVDDWDGVPEDESDSVFSIVGGATDAPVAAAHGFWLKQNQPNPFRARTELAYGIPSPARVRLDVFDARGRLVTVLVDEDQAAGAHRVPFGIGAPAPGVYFYRLRAGERTSVRKMVLLP